MSFGEQLDVSAEKMVDVLDTEKTHRFLQKLYLAATSSVRARSDDSARQIPNGENIDLRATQETLGSQAAID